MILVFALAYVVTPKAHLLFQFQFFIVRLIRMHYEAIRIAAIRISHSVP